MIIRLYCILLWCSIVWCQCSISYHIISYHSLSGHIISYCIVWIMLVSIRIHIYIYNYIYMYVEHDGIYIYIYTTMQCTPKQGCMYASLKCCFTNLHQIAWNKWGKVKWTMIERACWEELTETAENKEDWHGMHR